jgi:hypothetical protein
VISSSPWRSSTHRCSPPPGLQQTNGQRAAIAATLDVPADAFDLAG